MATLLMSQIKKWATDTLYASTEYTALAESLVGSKLNFYRSVPANRIVEALPFFTAFTGESDFDFDSRSSISKEWMLPFAIGIDGVDVMEPDSGVSTWTASDKAEALAMGAVDILKQESRNCGIYGNDVRITRVRVIVTEIGEADDVQANVFLTFGEENHI